MFLSEATTSVKKRNDEVEEMTFRSHLDQEWRRFSIDLVPKVLFLLNSAKKENFIDDCSRQRNGSNSSRLGSLKIRRI